MDVSVVLVPLVGGEALAGCARRLRDAAGDLELLVAPTEAAGPVEGARLLPEDEIASVPRLRARALEAARGEVVAFLEDTSRPDPGWLPAVRRLFEDGVVGAAGGPVRLDARLGARARALAYLEYGAWLTPPQVPTSTRRLPGNHFAVRRTALQDCRELWRDGLREAELAPVLADKGSRVVIHPRMAVTYAWEDPDLARLSTRYHHGRIYGGHRYGSGAWGSRLAMAASCPGLPFVLAARAWGHGRADARRSLLSLPWLLVYSGCWSLGEGLGYLVGAGASDHAWR